MDAGSGDSKNAPALRAAIPAPLPLPRTKGLKGPLTESASISTS